MTVHRDLTELRHPRPRGAGPPRAPPGRTTPPLPSPRATAWLFRNIEDAHAAMGLSATERADVEAVCARCPALARVRALAAAFTRLLGQHIARKGQECPDYLEDHPNPGRGAPRPVRRRESHEAPPR